MFNDEKEINDSIDETAESTDSTSPKENHSTEETKETEEDYKIKYLKVLAEMENLRKRAEQERKDIVKFRAASFIQNILPTVDMFEMAMNAQNASEEVKNWLMGFEMILNNFKQALEAEGVKEVVAKKGDEYHHSVHQAIEEVEAEEGVEPGQIVAVKMKGYTIHDRLLRPASVTVAKKENTESTEEVEKEGE